MKAPYLLFGALCLMWLTGCVHQRSEKPASPMRLVTAETDLIIAAAGDAALAKYPESEDLKLISATHYLAGDAGEEIQVRFELPTVALKDASVQANTKKGYVVDVRLDVFGKVISVTKSDFSAFEYTGKKKAWVNQEGAPATVPRSHAEDLEVAAASANGMVSVFFGERLPDGSLRRTRKIIWKPANQYGWDVTVFSRAPSIKVKEVLTLPGPATFINKPDEPSAPTKNVSLKVSSDQQTLVKEFILDTSKPVKYRQTFKILETDPKGTHRFQFFINDSLASDVEFEVGD